MGEPKSSVAASKPRGSENAFVFKHEASERMSDDELGLSLSNLYAAGDSPWSVPAYCFDMLVGGHRAGTVSLRVGASEGALFFAGHIGFAVEPEFRGRRLAARSVRLILPLVQKHDIDPVWFTCAPNNRASKRTIEMLGAAYHETVPLPAQHHAYRRGEREKCRFWLAMT